MRGGAAARKAYIAETLEERLKRVAADIRGASGVDFRAELADDLDGDLVNAGAIESQRRVLVTRKAASCLSDDELAVIMGHEAGHIAHLDGSRAARFSTVSNALIQETVEDVDNYMKGRNAGPIARAAAKLGAGVLTAGATAIGGRVYRQMREYEADDAGIDFAAAANYDTEAGATALEKLDPRTDGPGVSYGSLLDTHPPRNERTARMRARARKKKN
jgi:putative metalloprotease